MSESANHGNKKIEGNYSILLTLVKKKKSQIIQADSEIYNCHKESISGQNVLQYATMIKSYVIWGNLCNKKKKKMNWANSFLQPFFLKKGCNSVIVTQR